LPSEEWLVAALALHAIDVEGDTGDDEEEGREEQQIDHREVEQELHGKKCNTDENEANTEAFWCKNHKMKLKTLQSYKKTPNS